MKKIFYFVIPLLLVANVAFAEWYNPLTWFNKPLGDTLSPMPMFYQSGTSILPRVRNLNLILDRGITVGDSTSTATGTIRYNSGSFEGYDGSNWGSLGGGSADALTTSTVFAGDISGTSSSLMIDKIRGRNVTTTQTPSIGYILKWDGTYWNYKPDDTGAGGGITNLNGQTGGTQSFASTTGGTAFYVISSADTHTFNFPATPIFTGVSTTYATTTVLRANGTTTLNGNQMPTTTCALGDVFVGYASGVIQCRATSTLGLQSTLTTGNLTAGTGLSFDNTRQVIGGAAQISVAAGYNLITDASSTEFASSSNRVIKNAGKWDTSYSFAHATATESVTGLEFSTQDLQLTTGYVIPLSASTTNWNTAYNTVNGSSTYWDTAYNRVNGTLSDGKYCTYASATGKISCNSTPFTGITSLAGQTGATQTISTTTGTGLSFKVVSSANNHDFQASIASGYNLVTDASSTEFASSSNKVIKTAPNWDTAYSVINSSSSNWDIAHNRTTKGTLTATKLCTWNAGGYFDCNTDPSASSGFTTTSINNFATTTFSFATGTATGIGLTITTSTSAVTFTPTVSSGYGIPLTASSTEWANAYNRIYGGTMTDAKYCTYASATGKISCNSEGGAGGGFTTTTFKTAYQSYATTTLNFATSSDTNLGLAVLIDTTGITLTPQWIGTLADARITSANKWNALDTASSSWNNAGNLAHATATESILGIDLTGQEFSLTSGYVIPSTTRATTWDDAYTKRVDTWTYPLQLSSNVASIASNYFLTTSTAFGGDVSGTSSAIAVADNSHNHDSTTISNLDASNDFNTGTLASTYGGIGTSTIKTNGVFFGYSPTQFGQDDRFTYNTSTNLLTVGNVSSTNWTANNSYLGIVKSGTWNGSDIDISDYTNLTASNGIQLNGDNIEPATNYSIPLTASSTNWNNFYDTPSTRITAGTLLSWSGNTLNGSSSPTFDSLWTTNASTTNLTVASSLYWGANNGLLEAVNGVVRATSTDNFLTTGTASATYVPFSYASSTFVPFSYASSTFSTFAYNSSTFPTFGYASSSYLLRSLLTAKGSLISYSNQPAELTVGGDGQKLTASSTTATGLAWASSTVVIPVSPSGFFNSDNDIFGNTPYSYSIYQMTCKLRGAITSTLPTVTMTIANETGSTVGTLLCNTSTAFYTTTTITNGNISANSNLQWTASNASGTFAGVLISVHATK